MDRALRLPRVPCRPPQTYNTHGDTQTHKRGAVTTQRHVPPRSVPGSTRAEGPRAHAPSGRPSWLAGLWGLWRAPGMRLYASSAGRLGRTQSPGGAVRRPWPQGAATCLPSRTGPLRPPSASSESSCVVGRVSPRPLCRSLSASAVLSSGPSRRLFWFGDVILPSSSRLPSSAPSVCDASPSCVAPGTLPLPERHRTLTAGGRGVRSLVTFSRVSIF